MEINSRSLAIYPCEMFGITAAISEQLNYLKETHLNMVKQYNEIVRNVLNSPILEMVKNTREMQLSFARSIQNALNPLAVQFEPVTQIQEAEIFQDSSAPFNMTVTFEGQFLFQDIVINTFAAGSKHGKFLKMLLTYDDNYVSDQEFRNEIDLADEFKGIGYIRRDLKRYLRRAGLEIEIRRIRNCGHKLLSIHKITN